MRMHRTDVCQHRKMNVSGPGSQQQNVTRDPRSIVNIPKFWVRKKSLRASFKITAQAIIGGCFETIASFEKTGRNHANAIQPGFRRTTMQPERRT
jgi:hypothetical protein